VKVTAAARWELRVAVGLWEKLGGSETRPYVTWSALANLSSLLKDVSQLKNFLLLSIWRQSPPDSCSSPDTVKPCINQPEVYPMRHVIAVLLCLVVCVPAILAKKDKGNATLKDLQPAGTTDKKNKNQQFDFYFDASEMSYVCRTSHKTEMRATDFVVGAPLTYELNDHKGKLKGGSGKLVKCTVVRVEKLQSPGTPQK
jgi:hypothetical protein